MAWNNQITLLENIEEALQYIGTGKRFLEKIPEPQAIKVKINK